MNDLVSFSRPDRGEENIPHTNEEIARIHWNKIVSDEVTFQGQTMQKDKFIHKAGSGPEEYVVPLVKFPATDDGNIRRCYITHAQGVEYRWIRRDNNDSSPKVSAIAFWSLHVLY